eukprot:9097260-Ditylum_brightwellii.AAC.1
MGRCAYPDTVNAAYDLINGYQDKARQQMLGNSGGDGKEEGDDIVPHANGAKTRPDIKCFNCGKKGHFSNQCPDEQKNATTMLTIGTEGAFQFTIIRFECEDTDNDSIPSLRAQMAGDSSSEEESKDGNSSIVTFFSMPSLNTKTSDSSSNDK